tara:strand:- start:1540 stop:2433 length:894 start_codon:yes stop_codon:yes gene_type:complete
MKVFLIGASGSIGWPLFQFLKKKKVITGTYHKNHKPGLIKFSLGVKKSENNLINKISNQDVVILMSAETNVSWVHANPKKSFNINYTYTIKFIRKLIQRNVRIVYFSSAEVFNGKKGYYNERSIPNPVNVYGKTKFKVENFLKKTKYKNYQIIRTGRNVNMSDEYRCMIKDTYLRLLNDDAKMAKDNLFTITHMNDFNIAMLKLIDSKSKNKIFHVCSDDVLSRVEFADLIKKNSKYKYKMQYRTVKFKDIDYNEPRACKNNLTCDITNKFLKIKFKNAKSIIKEKVKILDKIKNVK